MTLVAWQRACTCATPRTFVLGPAAMADWSLAFCSVSAVLCWLISQTNRAEIRSIASEYELLQLITRSTGGIQLDVPYTA